MQKIFILLILFKVNIYGQSIENIDCFLRTVEQSLSDIKKIELTVDVELKYFTHLDTLSNSINYKIIKDSNSTLGYNFYAHDLLSGNKQWLCDNIMFVTDMERKIINSVDFNKYGANDFKKNRFNGLIIKVFSGEFSSSILNDTSITNYSLSYNKSNSNYILTLFYRTPPEVEFYKEEYIIDAKSYIILETKSTSHWDGMSQMFHYSIRDINQLTQNSFCDEIKVFDNYRLEEYIPEINVDSTFISLKKLPDFILNDIDDNTVSSQNFTRITLLYFWYLGCYPCRKSTPIIDSIYRIYPSKEINIFSINPYDTPTSIKKYIREKDIQFPILYGGKDFCTDIGLYSFPKILIINSNNDILYVYNGYSDDMYADLTLKLNEILKYKNEK